MSIIAGSLAGIWGSLFLFYNFPSVALIAYTYFAISILGVVLFWKRRAFTFLKYSQLISALILPFFALIVMGGYSTSSVVIVWALLTPFGALLFSNYKQAPYWFFLFLVALFFGGIIGNSVTPEIVFPDDIIQLFFFLNLAGMTFIIFNVTYYFVEEKEKVINLLNNFVENQFSVLMTKYEHAEKQLQSYTAIEPVFFMIISVGGTAKYSKFYSKVNFDQHLISGFLTAINSLGQGTFGSKILSVVSYKDFSMLFDMIKDYKIVYAFRGDQLNAKSKFKVILEKLNTKEFDFVFDNAYSSINDNPTINGLIDSIFFESNEK